MRYLLKLLPEAGIAVNPDNSRRNGMALVIVLAFSAILLVLGTVYLRTFSQTTHVSRIQIENIQAEFFARGLQNIALYKVKRFPDYFLRSYRYYAYKKRVDAGDPDVSPPIRSFENPSPFEMFSGRDGDILQHLNSGDDTAWQFTAPLQIATWSTTFNLRSSEDFNRAFIEIDVYIRMEGRDNVGHYRMSLDASQTSAL